MNGKALAAGESRSEVDAPNTVATHFLKLSYTAASAPGAGVGAATSVPLTKMLEG